MDEEVEDLEGGKIKEVKCVDVPMQVNNAASAIAALGGMDVLDKALSGENGYPVEMIWDPNAFLGYGVYAEEEKVNRYIVKVKRDSKTREIFHSHVVGHASSVYKFDSLYDYQYLPFTSLPPEPRKEGEPIINKMETDVIDTQGYKFESFLDRLLPSGVTDTEWLSRPDAPMFIRPFAFQRGNSLAASSNAVASFPYITITDEVRQREIEPKSRSRIPYSKREGDESSGKLSSSSGVVAAKQVTFQSLQNEVPQEDPAVLRNTLTKSGQTQMDIVLPFFESRPVWTKQALVNSLNKRVSAESLRLLLPCLAYYFTNGPWGRCWVRYGYNPRANPTEAIEVRLCDVTAPVNMGTLGKKHVKSLHLPVASSRKDDSSGPCAAPTPTVIEVGDRFHPKQNYRLQLIDIHLDQIQAAVSANDGKEGECTLVDGFLETGGAEIIRDLLRKHIWSHAR